LAVGRNVVETAACSTEIPSVRERHDRVVFEFDFFQLPLRKEADPAAIRGEKRADCILGARKRPSVDLGGLAQIQLTHVKITATDKRHPGPIRRDRQAGVCVDVQAHASG
jgi:hypothetical protein